jgi:hypothetical protein
MNTIRSPAPGGVFFNVPNNLKKNSAFNAVVGAANTAANTAYNAMNTMRNTVANVVPLNTNTNTKAMPTRTILLSVFVLIVVVIFGVFWRQIQQGLYYTYDQIRALFGAKPTPPPSEEQSAPVLEKPEPPQDSSPSSEKKLVEKILPGRQQVFNISKNTYTYYDAEPLCKALGAELATYEQVKQAYEQGADWCNYGWTKGQMAVYPTQKGTWEQLQAGPEEQRNACGRPGINGGAFDNPELRFGVNCYGVKPDQKDHDASSIAAGQGAPLSPGQLEFERKTNKYRGEANSIAILPWSKETWSA